MTIAGFILRRLPVILIGSALVLGFADFHRFVSRVGALEPPAFAEADALVALTGGSGHRIAVGLRLLQVGAGERLLVSGVNPSVDVPSLIKAAGGEQALYDCCIDIGRRADSTHGNATETAEWVEEHGYSSLIIVTSDYHMPRALLWFRDTLPDTELIPYPVESRIKPRQWWSSWTSIRGLVLEWAKYRATEVLKVFD